MANESKKTEEATPKNIVLTGTEEQSASPQPTEDEQSLAPILETDLPPADFNDWDLAPKLLKSLLQMGYDRPMPVQTAVFTTVSEGHDLMVQSKTGSGKTAAFGIPIVQRLADEKKGAQALILAPTRELAMQVAKEIEKLTANMDITVVPIYGGTPINPQITKLADGAQIIAGTPGRVLDHIGRKTMDTSAIKMLVLDECDEMLSMGFQEEIEKIIKSLPSKEERQTLLFSATIPKGIEKIGRRHMRDPQMLTLSSDNVGANLIDHYYYVVSGMARTRDLVKLMKIENPSSAIIFCNTREETNTVAKYLRNHNYDAEALSSDLSQKDRERVMARMREKNLDFLVATDIAARGIDISELSHVINFTFPPSPEVYVHRTGRTGRAGRKGIALSLVGPREIGAFYYLKLIYKIIPIERELPTPEQMSTIEEGEQYKKLIAAIEGKAKSESRSLANRLWQSSEGERVVALLLQQFLKQQKQKTKTPIPILLTASAASTITESSPTAPRSDKSTTTESKPQEGGDRKRRRRRHMSDETQSSMSSKADSVPSSSAANSSTVVTEKTSRGTKGMNIQSEAEADSTLTGSDTPPSRTRRRRRRKGGETTEHSMESVPENDTPLEDVASVPDVIVSSRAAQISAEANPSEKQVPETESQERPHKKRRHRQATNEQKITSRIAIDEQELSKDEKALQARTTKRRKAVIQKTPGTHTEFWEVWADSKEPDKELTVSRYTIQTRSSEQVETGTFSVRLFLNIGKREEANEEEIREFLIKALGDEGDSLGKITLRNTHAYVRVPEEIADNLIQACSGLVFHDREVVLERARR